MQCLIGTIICKAEEAARLKAEQEAEQEQEQEKLSAEQELADLQYSLAMKDAK